MNGAKLWFWFLLDALVIFVIVNLLFFVMPFLAAWKDSFAPARTITITAEGMTTATPDMAEISFSVVSQGKDPSSLSDNNNTEMNSVLQFVSSQGIASSDIATTGYDLEPNYQYDKEYNRNDIVGYTLTQTVQVKVRDLTKVASVLGGLAPLGVNQVSGVDFTFQDPNEFVAIARADALTKAETEADQMAAQAGVSIGAVVNVNESQYIPGPQPYFANGASSAGMAMAAPVAPTIQPGTQDVTDSVTVTYQLK